MADQWTIDINDGAFVFPITTRFSLRERAQFTDNGELDFFETVIMLQGKIIGTTPDVAKSSTTIFKQILALLEAATPVRVQLILNGVTEHDFKPGDNIGTPRIAEVVELTGGATRGTHIKFEMNIYVKTPKSAGSSVTEFTKTASAEFYNDRLLKATWSTRAVASNVATAKAKVLATKPNITPLHEVHREGVRRGEYEATWTYDKTRLATRVNHRESVAITKAGRPKTVDPRVGAFAAYFKGRPRPGTIVVTVEMSATRPDVLIRPPLHYQEGPNIHRDRTKEPAEQEMAMFDPVKGLWRSVFTEFWYWDGHDTTNAPKPKHDSIHNNPFPEHAIPIAVGGVKLK